MEVFIILNKFSVLDTWKSDMLLTPFETSFCHGLYKKVTGNMETNFSMYLPPESGNSYWNTNTESNTTWEKYFATSACITLSINNFALKTQNACIPIWLFNSVSTLYYFTNSSWFFYAKTTLIYLRKGCKDKLPVLLVAHLVTI